MQPRQPRVEAVGRDELFVRALLDDLARLHHQDAVAGEHGREPVRDDEGGAILHQPIDPDKTEEAFGRNRRIELKLTER